MSWQNLAVRTPGPLSEHSQLLLSFGMAALLKSSWEYYPPVHWHCTGRQPPACARSLPQLGVGTIVE